MAIQVLKYTFYCVWKTEAKLPEYLGSTLRGSLGWALKKCSCALHRQECASCALRPQCAYAWLFETDIHADPGGTAVNARQHPFIIEPHGEVRQVAATGDAFEFSIVLIGQGNAHLPMIAHSVKLMGEEGIGSGRKFGLGRFSLEKIFWDGHVIFDRADGVLHALPPLSPLDVEEIPREVTEKINLRCATPLRVKFENKLNRELPFHILIRTALRRVASLEYSYGGKEPELDFPGIVKRAESVETTRSQLRWRDLLRYSNRQGKKVSLGGMVGVVSYCGDLTEFMPILRYCEKVHIGKQTVFGLGKIVVGSDSPDYPRVGR